MNESLKQMKLGGRLVQVSGALWAQFVALADEKLYLFPKAAKMTIINLLTFQYPSNGHVAWNALEMGMPQRRQCSVIVVLRPL